MTSLSKFAKHFVLDVEADGPHPLEYNMISFALVSVVDPAKAFKGQVRPIHDNNGGLQEARDVVGVSYQTQLGFEDPTEVMPTANTWLEAVSQAERVIIWSDNPAFDWQYWNAYSWRFAGRNVGGFSARRIGDLDAGRRASPLTTNAWKKRRITDHTHDPLDDARGNAEALRWVLEQFGG